jgi:hypothetical protein
MHCSTQFKLGRNVFSPLVLPPTGYSRHPMAMVLMRVSIFYLPADCGGAGKIRKWKARQD